MTSDGNASRKLYPLGAAVNLKSCEDAPVAAMGQDGSGLADLEQDANRPIQLTRIEPASNVLSKDDYKNLIEQTPSRIACFLFEEGIPTTASPSKILDRLWSGDGFCIEANFSFARSCGHLSSFGVIGQFFRDLIPRKPPYIELFTEFAEQGCRLGRRKLVEENPYTYERYVLDVGIYPTVRDSFFHKLWIVQRDITQIQRAVDETLQAETHYRTLVERPGLVLVRTRPDGTYIYVSPHCVDITGRTADEFMSDPGLFPSFLHPDDIQKHEEIYRARRHGEIRPVEVEYRLRHIDGTYHWFMERQTPKFNDNGEVEYFDSIALDIQEKKELQDQLTHAERMNTVGTLAAGIAHDFNNHLTAMLGQLGLALTELDPNSDAFGHLAAAEQAALCCAEMSKQLLSFGKKSGSDMKLIDIGSLTVDTFGLLSHLLPASVETELDIEENLPFASGNFAQLQQVLINLAVNARDAMQPDGGKLSVRLSTKTLLDTRPSSSFPQAPPGDYVLLAVEDQGCGIPEEILPSIFDPFFTTKADGKGSGLGLSMAYSIVRAHGGWIQVHSSAEAGTRFEIVFPAFAPAQQAQASDEQIEDLRGVGTVLVAEDEEMILSMVESALSLHGYTVLTARDGEEAVQLFKERGHEIDIAFIDYTMPKFSGRHVVQEIRKTQERLPVILTSGYGDKYSDDIAGLEQEYLVFVNKPYPLPELLILLKRMLSEKEAQD